MTLNTEYQVIITKKDGTEVVYQDSGLDRFSFGTAEMLAKTLNKRYYFGHVARKAHIQPVK